MEKINFRQRRDFSQKISATFDFITQNFRSLFKCLLFIVGPVALLAGVFSSYYLQYYFRMISGSINSPEEPELMFNYMYGEFAFIVGGLIITWAIAVIMAMSVIYDYIKIYVEQDEVKPVEPGQVLKLLKKDVFRILGAAIVVGLIMMMAGFIMIIPILGVLIAFPLIIYLSVAFSMIFIIVVYERENVFNAISRSFNLISGKWWSTFGLLIVCYLIQSVISFIFIIPTYAVHGMALFHSIEDGFTSSFQLSTGENILSIVLSSISTIGTNLLYAISLVALAFQYFNLVERKEGAGLMQEIDQMGKEDLIDDQEKY